MAVGPKPGRPIFVRKIHEQITLLVKWNDFEQSGHGPGFFTYSQKNVLEALMLWEQANKHPGR